MKKHALMFAVMIALASAAMAQAPGVAKDKAPPAHSPEAVSAQNLNWGDLDPAGAPGVKIADVWGNHAMGGFGAFVKFPAGFTTPLHTHTNEFKIVVISGNFIQVPEGKPEIRLGPGSYLRQPAGNYRHTSGCDKASECLFFVQASGKFDLLPVAKK
jgi:hypothetical protein